MASANKSEKLGLSLWEETDKPERADFVSDNEIIEQLLGAHLSDSTQHLTASQKNFLNRPVWVQQYIGDGASQKDIEMPVALPGIIIVWGRNCPPWAHPTDAQYPTLYFGFATNYATNRLYSTRGLSVISNKYVRVKQDSNPGDWGVTTSLNEKNREYYICYVGPRVAAEE